MNSCQFCGKPTPNAKFCSRSCAGLGGKRMIQQVLIKICLECEKEFNASGNKRENVYCSQSCAATSNNRKFPKRGFVVSPEPSPKRIKNVKANCKNCGEIVNNHASIFCSTKCNFDYKKQEYIANWLANGIDNNSSFPEGHAIREYIRADQNNQCAICLADPIHNELPIRFVLDHISGDASNNSRENLRLVCPNCDSQLDTYKSKNKGNGRHSRRQRYAEGKSF
jgi:hypothetical protein